MSDASDASSTMRGVDLRDPDLREELARAAYLRQREDEVAREREHDLEDADYYCLDWPCLSESAKRPYRTAVAVALDAVTVGA